MRQTKLTKALLSILEEKKQPLSVPTMLKILEEKHNLTPNKTTIYRQLQKLTENDRVEEILITNNTTHYELKNHHHHHFVCNSCDDIQCIDSPELEAQIHALEHALQTNGHKVNHHQFSFSGTCKTCTD